jgi:CTP:phosphocholine cytidylyltransferase-like protein
MHKRRASNQVYSLYQSPKIYVIKPDNFMRRNNSEQKQQWNSNYNGSFKNGEKKPLSLMSSMKKFEVGLEDITPNDLLS